MASTTSRRSSRLRRPASDECDVPVAPRRRRAARLRWRWLVAAGVVAALVWFLPGLVAHTPLGGWLIARATSQLNGTLTVGRMSLGWFAPVVAGDLRVSDAQGQAVMELAELRTGRSLLGLLTHLSDLGALDLNQPRLRVELRGDGSNIEDLLAEWLRSRESTADVGLELSITQGELTLIDSRSGRRWTVDGLEGRLSLPRGRDVPLRAKLDARLADPRQPGRVAADLALVRGPADGAEGAGGGSPDASFGNLPPRGEVSLRAVACPLALVQPILARCGVSVVLDGWLNGEGTARWSREGAKPEAAARGQFTAADLRFGAPWLGDDRVALERVETRFGLVREEGGVRLDPRTLACDLGSLVADGRFDARRLDGAALAALADQSWRVEGRIDLARLAAALPGILRIRPQTRITGGELQWSLESQPAAVPAPEVAKGPDVGSSPEVAAFAGKKIAAGICGILLGGLGVHKFILGLNTAGIIMLAVTLAGAITTPCLIVPVLAPMAMGVIGLVEGILYLIKSDEEFYQTYAIQKRQWF